MIHILSILILCLPTAWELYNDRRGDLNKKEDVFIRFALMIGFASGAHLISGANWLTAFNLSVAIFFMFFDYIIVMILNRNVYDVKQNWFAHLGKTGIVDKISFWVKIGPWGRFGIRAVYFVIALVLYIKTRLI